MFLASGADPCARNADGQTALDCAAATLAKLVALNPVWQPNAEDVIPRISRALLFLNLPPLLPPEHARKI